jgi:heptosyltransferase-2
MSNETRDPRILVARGGAIGDFVLTLPAIQALRERWPGAHIELLGYPHIAELARAVGLVDRVESLDKAEMARYFAYTPPRISEEQAAYMKSFDFVVSYLYDPSGTAQNNMRLAGAPQVLYQPPQVERGHAIEHLFKPLEQLAIFPQGELRPVLDMDAAACARGAERIRGCGSRVLAIHPGSGSPRKNWPLEKFLSLARAARDRLDLDPLILIGEAEVEALPEVDALHKEIPLLSHLSLVELAEVFSACAAYVGNDSGATHVAAAVGIPVLALFGPSDARAWAPRGDHTQVIIAESPTTDSLRKIEVETVLEALQGLCAG